MPVSAIKVYDVLSIYHHDVFHSADLCSILDMGKYFKGMKENKASQT